ncbi:MAG: hypothetical protein QNI86_04300 [Halieaceae bacterium]|nr:hypothetical protein [Halieaceae bacterium]
MSTLIPIGPTLTGTVVTPDLDTSLAAYCDYLHASVLEEAAVSSEQARLWGKPQLEGSPLVTLQSPSGAPWMRLLGIPGLLPAQPFKELGWMALEILVEDVAALWQTLDASPFEIYRGPTDSGNASGMQLVGPAGEVLYLTQLRAPEAPFDIAPAQAVVDRLFTPVSACLRRDEALAVYSKLGARRSWSFDTTLGSVNRAHGLDPSLKHPVGTVQLSGRSMVEINQLGVAKSRPPVEGKLPAGIVMVSFVVDNLDNIGLRPISPPLSPTGALYGGQRVAACRGAAGELLELIEVAG